MLGPAGEWVSSGNHLIARRWYVSLRAIRYILEFALARKVAKILWTMLANIAPYVILLQNNFIIYSQILVHIKFLNSISRHTWKWSLSFKFLINKSILVKVECKLYFHYCFDDWMTEFSVLNTSEWLSTFGCKLKIKFNQAISLSLCKTVYIFKFNLTTLNVCFKVYVQHSKKFINGLLT